MKINENKSDINDLYKEIGRKVYEKHVREENIDIKGKNVCGYPQGKGKRGA